ncbi:MAG: prolipoprotein diacylglyceryl transferase [Planctomycetes bacterium]|nr:prolipoprotein diacylglyceryl transferase [Planctomycetota bacterium]
MPLNLAEIPFPNIDPVAFTVFGFEIRWYGIAYVAAFLLAQWLLRRLAREKLLPLSERDVGDFIFFAMIGTIVGGRLGYILFYKFSYYFEHPAEVLQVWRGGLSFHGGLIGVIAALALFARKRGVAIAQILDAAALVVTPGILCVRLANFINGELWGRPSDVPWAMVFPTAEAGGVPRHPSQLYEAAFEGALMFVVLWNARKTKLASIQGALFGLFLLLYGAGRFIIEFAREPDQHLGTVLGPLSMGQVLCTAMMILGTLLLLRRRQATAA